MVRELKIIFGLDAVACKLGIARHALVFFEQLGGIAALAVVLAIAVRPSATNTRGPLPTTTATAAALTIIDQIRLPSKQKLPLSVVRAAQRPSTADRRGSDPFVPVWASEAPSERPIASGVDGMRSAFVVKRARS
jgi:hypothetical protein